MLVLKRCRNERIMIGHDIVITVVDVCDGYVRLGITAPAGLRVDREEIRIRIERGELRKERKP